MTGSDVTAPIHVDGATRDLPPGPPRRRRVLAELARAEARRNLRAPWLWLGVAASAWMAQLTLSADYAAGGYQGVMGSFAGIAAAAFVIGAVSGGRDRGTPSELPLAEEAVTGAEDRAVARLAGMVPVVGVGALYVAAVVALTHWEGGFWVGDTPGRTDTARYGSFEVLQPVALFVLAAAAGVAIGRTRVPRALACILGSLAILTSGFISWAWQGDPVVFATLIQTQPFELPLAEAGRSIDFASIPADWLLSAPDRYDMRWAHVVIDQRVAGAHDLYLVGLAALAGGTAVRNRAGRTTVVVGVLLAVAGLVAQVALHPGG